MRVAGIASIALVLAGCQSDSADAPIKAAEEPALSERADTTIRKVPVPPAVAPDKRQSGHRSARCGIEEETLFACKTARDKHISVCAGDEGVSYRFGGERPEITVQGGRWASVPYSGGGELQIAFENGDTRYIVFSRMVRTNFDAGEPNNPAISDGVIVLRGENVLGLQMCDDPDNKPADYDLAERSLPRVDDLFTYETGRADP